MQYLSSATAEYRADIDGIRSLAVLSVIVFHLNADWLPGGFLGVDVFFVVSGFLITNIILRENKLKSFTFKNFYARRVKRIFPALFATLIFSAAIGVFLLHPRHYRVFASSLCYASAQLANFFFARKVDYFDEGFAEQPLLHTWTLGVEEQFYLFWPLLIVFLFWLLRTKKQEDVSRKIGGAFILIAIVSFIACYFFAETNHNIAFYMFYTRAWEFCLGGLVAVGGIATLRSKWGNSLISLLGIFLLFFSFVMVDDQFLGTSFLQFGVVLPCVGTLLLIFSDPKKGFANRLLSTAIPVFVGKISYSLYLVHWPIIIFYRNFNLGSEVSPTASLGILITALVLATMSYYLVEQPARRSRIDDRYVLVSALVVIIVFAASFKKLEAYDKAPWRIKKYSDGTRKLYSALPRGCVTKFKGPTKYKECITTKKKDAPWVALVGDSHTIHYLKSTVTWARQFGYNVLYLSSAGCPILLGDITYGHTLNPDYEQRCDVAFPFFESEIINNEKFKYIFLAQRFDLLHNGKGYLANRRLTYYFKDASGKKIQDHTNYYRNQLTYTTEELKKAGKELVILKQVPLFPGTWDCAWEPRLKKWLTPENFCSYNTSFITKWQKPSSDFIDEFITTNQLKSFDPSLFLDKPRKNNRKLYENIDHLNGNGCHYLVPHFVREMKKLMGDG